MSDRKGRLIPFRHARPAENMAVDQALLESVGRGGCPVLRFYGWSEPTLSLGYFQPLADRRQHHESDPLSCIRRATGGGAIVHDRELTYSIVMPVDRFAAGPRSELYRQTHQAFVCALGGFGVRLGPFRSVSADETLPRDSTFLCFQRRTAEDLVMHGYKVLGSAQRKTASAVLQHGSLLLRASPWAPQLPGIGDLSDLQATAEQLADSIAGAIGRLLNIDWSEARLGDSEMKRAGEIEQEKFANRRWTARR